MRGTPLVDKGGMKHRFGMDDASTGQLLVEVAEDRAFADFTVAYFADNDYRSHEIGPHAALKVVAEVDSSLARMFEAAGGMETMLRDTYVIITSDHGHCEVLDDAERATIHLDVALGEFKQAALGKPWADGDEIMICPNMRAAEVYLRHHDAAALLRVIEQALGTGAWTTRSGACDAKVRRRTATRPGMRMATWSSGEGKRGATARKTRTDTDWSWRGDLGVLDAHVEDGRLRWNDYPNAFERITGALDAPKSGAVWFTAAAGVRVRGAGRQGARGRRLAWRPARARVAVSLRDCGSDQGRSPDDMRSVDIAPFASSCSVCPRPCASGDPRP